MSQREERNFVIKINFSFDDNLARFPASRFHRKIPRLLQILRFFIHGLAMSRRRHCRFDEAGEADRFGSRFKLGETSGKMVMCSGGARPAALSRLLTGRTPPPPFRAALPLSRPLCPVHRCRGEVSFSAETGLS